MNLKIILF